VKLGKHRTAPCGDPNRADSIITVHTRVAQAAMASYILTNTCYINVELKLQNLRICEKMGHCIVFTDTNL
jgi:hypothetical protein